MFDALVALARAAAQLPHKWLDLAEEELRKAEETDPVNLSFARLFKRLDELHEEQKPFQGLKKCLEMGHSPLMVSDEVGSPERPAVVMGLSTHVPSMTMVQPPTTYKPLGVVHVCKFCKLCYFEPAK